MFKTYRENFKIFYSLYNVYLKDTGIISTLITNTIESPVLTLELFIRSKSHGGTLMSYLSKHIFAISNEQEMRMFIGNEIYHTGIFTDIGK